MKFNSYLKVEDRKKANINTVKMLLDIAKNHLDASNPEFEYWFEAKIFYSELLNDLCERASA